MEKYDITDYLKDDKELQKAVIDEFLKEITELKAENEKLKSEVGKLTQTCGSLLNIQYALADSCKKYSETLQEIKAIAERQLLVTNVRTYQMVYYADFSEYRNEILEKITKAEEE